MCFHSFLTAHISSIWYRSLSVSIHSLLHIFPPFVTFNYLFPFTPYCTYFLHLVHFIICFHSLLTANNSSICYISLYVSIHSLLHIIPPFVTFNYLFPFTYFCTYFLHLVQFIICVHSLLTAYNSSIFYI